MNSLLQASYHSGLSSDEFVTKHDVTVTATEFGLARWVPGGSTYMDDQMGLFKRLRMNNALWVWDPVWEPYRENDAFNFLRGADPRLIPMSSQAILSRLLPNTGVTTLFDHPVAF